jgi:hypothetical protein
VHAGFGIRAIERTPQGLRVVAEDAGRAAIEGIDEIVAATGSRPELSLTRELRMRHDPWLESTDALAPLIDPNVHGCGTVRPHGHRELAHPEPGFFAIGAKSYGRAPNFLLARAMSKARSVVAALAGDLAAADDVQLELLETGVCSVDRWRTVLAMTATLVAWRTALVKSRVQPNRFARRAIRLASEPCLAASSRNDRLVERKSREIASQSVPLLAPINAPVLPGAAPVGTRATTVVAPASVLGAGGVKPVAVAVGPRVRGLQFPVQSVRIDG